MSTLLIVNPAATTTQEWIRDAIADAIGQLGPVDLRLTAARGHAGALARDAVVRGVSHIATFGGDGTINEVVNGMLSAKRDGLPTLLTIPGGHTNVFTRILGIPQDPLEATGALLAGARRAHRREVKVAKADDRYFLFSAGLGLDAEVLRRVERQRAQGARASIPRFVASAILAQAVSLPPAGPRITVALPDGARLAGVYTAIVQNAPVWTYAGSLPITFAPGATFDNGLSVFGIRSQDPLRLARHLARATLRPTRLDEDSAASDLSGLQLLASEPTPFQVDGDVVGDREAIDFTAAAAVIQVGLPSTE